MKTMWTRGKNPHLHQDTWTRSRVRERSENIMNVQKRKNEENKGKKEYICMSSMSSICDDRTKRKWTKRRISHILTFSWSKNTARIRLYTAKLRLKIRLSVIIDPGWSAGWHKERNIVNKFNSIVLFFKNSCSIVVAIVKLKKSSGSSIKLWKILPVLMSMVIEIWRTDVHHTGIDIWLPFQIISTVFYFLRKLTFRFFVKAGLIRSSQS